MTKNTTITTMKTTDLIRAIAEVLGLDMSELTAAHAAFVSDLKEEAGKVAL